MNNKKYFNSPKIIVAFVMYLLITILIFYFALSSGTESTVQSNGFGKMLSDVVSFITNDKINLEKDGKTPSFPDSITASAEKTELLVGESVRINYSVTPEKDFPLAKYSFVSSNTNCITVDENGVATALGEGESIITVKETVSSTVDTIKLKVVSGVYTPSFSVAPEDDAPFITSSQGIGGLYKLIPKTNLKEVYATCVYPSENANTLIKCDGGFLLYTKTAGQNTVRFYGNYINSLGEQTFTYDYTFNVGLDENVPTTTFLTENEYNINITTKQKYTKSINYEDGLPVSRVRKAVFAPAGVTVGYGTNYSDLVMYSKVADTYSVQLIYVDKNGLNNITYTLNVSQARPDSVEMSSSHDYAEIGTSKTLFVLGDGAKLNADDFTWSVDDESVATITASGAIKGLKAGTVTVTATSKTFENMTVIKTYTVRHSYQYEVRKLVGHFSLFLLLSFFAFAVYSRLCEVLFDKSKLLLSAIITATVGLVTACISEVLQLELFTVGRGASIKDVFIDFGGFVLGFAIVFTVKLIKQKLKDKKIKQ